MSKQQILKIVGGIVAALVLVVGGFAGFVMYSMSGLEPMGAYVLADGKVEIVLDGYVSMVVLDTSDGGVVVVDAGNDPEGKALLDELSERGLGKDDVRAFVITHGHPDHTAALPLFPSTPVYALAAEVDLVEGKRAAGGPLPRLFPPTDHGVKAKAVRDGAILEFPGLEIEVFAIPGHTKGSAAYIAHDVLIMGDSAAAASANEIAPAPWIFTTDSAQNRQSLKDLGKKLVGRRLEITDTVYSHSGPHQGIGALTKYDRPPPMGT